MTERKFTHPDNAPAGHEWQTTSGQEVIIWEAEGEFIYGRYRAAHGGSWLLQKWACDGRGADAPLPSSSDLMDKPRARTVWPNMYPAGLACYTHTRQRADDRENDDRIACLEVTFRDGEGL